MMKIKKCLKKRNQFRYLKFLVWLKTYLKTYNYFKNMAEVNINEEFSFKTIDE